MILEITPFAMLNSLTAEEKKSLAKHIRSDIIPKSVDKALYSKYPKVAMRHSLKIIRCNQILDMLESKENNEIPKLNFEVK